MSPALAVACHECEYEWDYSGERDRATCPNCLSQTPVESGEDGLDAVVVADGGVVCEYCGEGFTGDAVPTTTIPSTTLYQCPECGRWTEESLPPFDEC